jgi:hypothetical protein
MFHFEERSEKAFLDLATGCTLVLRLGMIFCAKAWSYLVYIIELGMNKTLYIPVYENSY